MRFILRENMGRYRLEQSGSGCWPLEGGCFVCGNEPWGSIKCLEVLKWLNNPSSLH
jgi:hypothetical protein